MASATSRTCWIWYIWFALIYGYRYLIGNRKSADQHKHWGCGCFSPTITPEEPEKVYFSCYCIIWIMAALSSQSLLFAADCRAAWKSGLRFLIGSWQQLLGLAEFASGWAVMIPWISVERSIRFLIYWGTLACSIVMAITILILLVKRGSAFYKKQIAGWNSFWIVVIVWMITIVLAADIKALLQINLLLINLICHAGFCLWKTVVKKRNDNTVACYSWKK